MRFAASAVGALLLGALWAAGPRFERQTLRVPMRDGVRLSANLFRPAGSGRLPVLLARTPYGKGTEPLPGHEAFLQGGYAVVVQDVRGRGQSEGRFRMMTQEGDDGTDTIAWIARQPWCDGRIGMVGSSYLGIVQWQAAVAGSPYLKAFSPVVSGCDDYYDRFYSRGGGLKLGHRLSWMAANLRLPSLKEPPFRSYTNNVPLRTSDRAATGRMIDFWQDALNHPSYDTYWRSLSTLARIERVQAPVFIIGGWFDNYAESDLAAFAAVSPRIPARIVVGPWPHAVGERFPALDFGRESLLPLRRMQVEWFDQHVRGLGKPVAAGNRVKIFVMGANKWRDEREWPIARTRYTPMYLSSRGKAQSAAGDGVLSAIDMRRSEPPDVFTYDPLNPVPTNGGAVCCTSKVWSWGPQDQRSVEARRDVLVYTSDVLTRDVEVTGTVHAILSVSTSAPDTDFTVKLVDVHPDGRAMSVCDGMLRLRYRESLSRPLPARPGEIYRVTIPAGVTSNVFRAGHRIRIEVSSSNFPRFDRNPNTGAPIADERQFKAAVQAIHHSRHHPSYVLLPVIP